jgi:hypothetical protein
LAFSVLLRPDYRDGNELPREKVELSMELTFREIAPLLLTHSLKLTPSLLRKDIFKKKVKVDDSFVPTHFPIRHSKKKKE